jgi:phospholipase C
MCGHAPGVGVYQGRCGPGPRLPLLVVSPWAKRNFVDTTFTTQASIIKFIEDNWLASARIGDQSFDATTGSLLNLFDFVGATRAPKMFLDPADGTVLGAPPADVRVAPPGPAPPPPPPVPPPPVAPPPAPPPGPPPPPPPPASAPTKPKLTVTGKRSGRKVTLSLRITNLRRVRATLGVKLLKGTRTLASATRSLAAGKTKVTVTLTAKRRVARGTYKVTVTVKQSGKVTKLSAQLMLK